MIPGNDDLFWAVLGGSPGNFGVLTHVRLRPHHDKDHPDSRMMYLFTPYTPEKHAALESIMAEMSDNKSLPSDFNYAVTILGKTVPGFHGPKYFNLREASGKCKSCK